MIGPGGRGELAELIGARCPYLAAVAVGGQLVDLPIVRRAGGLLTVADRLAQERAIAAPAGDSGLEVG